MSELVVIYMQVGAANALANLMAILTGQEAAWLGHVPHFNIARRARLHYAFILGSFFAGGSTGYPRQATRAGRLSTENTEVKRSRRLGGLWEV